MRKLKPKPEASGIDWLRDPRLQREFRCASAGELVVNSACGGTLPADIVQETTYSAFLNLPLLPHSLGSCSMLAMPDQFPWAFKAFGCLASGIFRVIMLANTSFHIFGGTTKIASR